MSTPQRRNPLNLRRRGPWTSPRQHHLVIDFLNMRLSFSVFAVQQACAALAADKACSAWRWASDALDSARFAVRSARSAAPLASRAMLRISSTSVVDAQPAPKVINVAAKATVISRAILADMSVLPKLRIRPEVTAGFDQHNRRPRPSWPNISAVWPWIPNY